MGSKSDTDDVMGLTYEQVYSFGTPVIKSMLMSQCNAIGYYFQILSPKEEFDEHGRAMPYEIVSCTKEDMVELVEELQKDRIQNNAYQSTLHSERVCKEARARNDG
jgi:hypothetical protein